MPRAPRVIICGAGMGGLVAGQALRQRVDLVVVDRDERPHDTGGYRISLNHEAVAVLRKHLDRDLLQLITATSDRRDAFGQFTLADARLRPIIVVPEDPTLDRLLSQRRALRLLLCRGLESALRFGSTVAAVSEDRDTAAVTLTDGTVLEADLVVGADGASSPTVRSLLGRRTAHHLGLIGIAGSSPLPTPADVPSYLRHGPALALSAGGDAVFLSTSTSDPSVHPAPLSEAIGPPSLIWGVLTRRGRLPQPLPDEPAELVKLALRTLDGWSGWLLDHVREATTDRVAAFPLQAVDLARPMFPWAPRHVTALGDAVHAMPPTGGQGASTAIADAGDLAVAIQRHLDGAPLAQALMDYQHQIEPRARAAVRESLGPVRMMRLLHQPVAQVVSAPVLRLGGAIGARRFGERGRP